LKTSRIQTRNRGSEDLNSKKVASDKWVNKGKFLMNRKITNKFIGSHIVDINLPVEGGSYEIQMQSAEAHSKSIHEILEPEYG
jgi:hypothetical protein